MDKATPSVVAYVAAGSNVEPSTHLIAAMQLLAQRLRLTGVSTVYRTPALGRPQDPPFMNCVFEVETEHAPRDLKFDVLRPIEQALGRQRQTDRFALRTIDLDLILYGDVILDQADLKLPHPDLSRWFVCMPIIELAPQLKDFVARYAQGIDALQGAAGCAPLPQITRTLRERIAS
jgi:2-amino-4-hydroxy-6-hydroxymethyldihydropteridine diphosphokinase